MTEHVVSIGSVGNGVPDFEYRATCTCRWRGIRTSNRAVVEAQAGAHLAYHRDVARLTAAATEPRAGQSSGSEGE